jgi:hypothetical protein
MANVSSQAATMAGSRRLPRWRRANARRIARKWVDHLVTSAATNLIVAGVGKEAIVFQADKETHRFAYPTSIGGLALDAKGRRLAASHYGGATLRYVLMADDKGTLR